MFEKREWSRIESRELVLNRREKVQGEEGRKRRSSQRKVQVLPDPV